jgi:FAD/FMN-containing dehydrogenase
MGGDYAEGAVVQASGSRKMSAASELRIHGKTEMNHWSNWAGNQTCSPCRYERPSSVAELQEIVAAAARRGVSVRPVGSGHSFAPLCVTDGVLVDIAALSGIETVTESAGVVTVLAGTRICDLGPALAEYGMALANQGDIDTQTIAGAIGTGTHGTGRRFGSLSSAVLGIELVTADGNVTSFTRDADADDLRAAALNLGVLGIATRVTLAIIPAYRLHEQNRLLSWPELTAIWESVESRTRNAEFYWLPAQDMCVLKTLNPTDAQPCGRHPLELAPPGTVERYLTPERIDASWRIYPSIRTVPFVEIEYSLPIAQGLDAASDVRQLMRSRHPDVTWAIEYRTQAGDDLLLSPTQNYDVAVISVHDSAQNLHPAFLREADALLAEYGGRPHWGKLHYRSRNEMYNLYPNLHSFIEIRSRLDPSGSFLNDALASLLA